MNREEINRRKDLVKKIKKLQNSHYPKISNREIAKAICEKEVSDGLISQWFRSPKFPNRLEQAHEFLKTKIEG